MPVVPSRDRRARGASAAAPGRGADTVQTCAAEPVSWPARAGPPLRSEAASPAHSAATAVLIGTAMRILPGEGVEVDDGHGRPRGALRGGTGRGTVAPDALWAAMVVGDDRAASFEADGVGRARGARPAEPGDGGRPHGPVRAGPVIGTAVTAVPRPGRVR